ncbi:MAG TPA: hypothetical protein VFH78_14565 [Candidatus Thermoplasmatota archaeon]|nr:hypothetical protein [Candidatus Thermoplasmatota archaeon]
MRTLTLLLTALLAGAALAGCTANDGGDEPPATTTPQASTPAATPTLTPTATPVATPPVTPTTGTSPLDSSTYTIETVGMPTQVKPGTRFNFTMYVNGSLSRESDHVGAHYADNDTVSPPEVPGRRDCEHDDGTFPGVFVVNCTLQNVGTWHVWGHARINDSGELRNWWSATPFQVKVRDYNVTLSNVPTSMQQSNQSFTVTLALAAINGSDNVTSDHIGVHWWNATEPEPTTANSAGLCEHVAGGSVGTYTIACAIANSGVTPTTFYIRGHLRLVDGPSSLSWWSAEHTVQIGPHVGLPI